MSTHTHTHKSPQSSLFLVNHQYFLLVNLSDMTEENHLLLNSVTLRLLVFSYENIHCLTLFFCPYSVTHARWTQIWANTHRPTHTHTLLPARWVNSELLYFGVVDHYSLNWAQASARLLKQAEKHCQRRHGWGLFIGPDCWFTAGGVWSSSWNHRGEHR